MPLKRLVFSLIAILLTMNVFSQQRTADLGIFGGGAVPFSDYSKINLMQSVGLNYGGFYRYNFNSRYGLRINALYGKVKADGIVDNGASSTPPSFEKNVIDLAAVFEINYLDFLMGEEFMNFSPYIYYGVGTSIYGGKPVLNIPIGTGVKYAFAKRWAVGLEYSMRKLFADDLDNLGNPYSEHLNLVEVNDYWHNNDWINYLGVTLTYKFYWGKTPCPAYGRIND